MTAILHQWGHPYQGIFGGGANNYSAATDLGTQNSAIGHVLSARLLASLGSETITRVGYHQGATTGTPAAGSYRIGLQTVGADGLPSGTWLGTNNAYADFTPAGANDNSWVWVTLDNSVSVARGAAVALVLMRTAATDAANKITANASAARWTGRPGMPYPLTHNGTAWTKLATVNPVMGYASATNLYGAPAKNLFVSQAFGATSEIGFTFAVPTTFLPSGATYQVLGVGIVLNTPATGANTYMATLYENPISGTIGAIAASDQFDADVVSSAGSADRAFEIMFSTGTLPNLAVGTKYGVGISTTGASGMALAYMETVDAGDFAAWHYDEFGMKYTTRTLTDYPPSGNDSNNFAAETTTRRPLAYLIIGDVTLPAGGGTNRAALPSGLSALG